MHCPQFLVCLRFLLRMHRNCTFISLWYALDFCFVWNGSAFATCLTFIFKMHWIFTMFLFSTWEFHQPQFVLYLRFLINMHENCAIHHDKPNIFHFELSSHWLSSHGKLSCDLQVPLKDSVNSYCQKEQIF